MAQNRPGSNCTPRVNLQPHLFPKTNRQNSRSQFSESESFTKFKQLPS